MSVPPFLPIVTGKKILVIGDVMLDQYVRGSVSRISPEAPVPVLIHGETSRSPGGAANVTLNLRGLEADVSIISVCGQDEEGQILKHLLSEQGVNTSYLLMVPSRVTTTKTRIMAGNQHLLRMDREENSGISGEVLVRFFDYLDQFLDSEPVHAVILQDYNKGVFTAQNLPLLMNKFEERRIPVAVDPKFDHFYGYQGCTIFKPNLSELRAAVPFQVHVDPESLHHAATYLREKLSCQIVLITLSDKGIFVDNGEEYHLIPAQKRLITDVCGAGDTVISVATLCWLAGLKLFDVAYWSGYCGTIVCQYPGVMPITADLLRSQEPG